MVDPAHRRLSLVRQCRLVSIARSSFYYEGTGESPLNLRLMRSIDTQFLETPFYGSRQMQRWLRRQGDTVSRKRVRRLLRLLGLHAVFQRPRTSQSHPGHRIYPYLLRDCQGRSKIRPRWRRKTRPAGHWTECLKAAVRGKASGPRGGRVLAGVLAVCEAIAVAVQLQDVDVMGESVEECTG